MKNKRGREEDKSGRGGGGVTVASCPFSPGLSRSRLFSLRLDMLRGFVNEMEALALCQYITQLGFLLSSFPSLLRCPLSLSYSSGDFPDCNMLESGYHHLATPRSHELALMFSCLVSLSHIVSFSRFN